MKTKGDIHALHKATLALGVVFFVESPRKVSQKVLLSDFRKTM